MNVLLLGSGGREHALAWKLAQSPLLGKLFAAPGNPGIAEFAQIVAIDPADHRATVDFCLKNSVELIVIGPEAPLVDGLADNLRTMGFCVFGPNRIPAQLEGSKGFTKDLCARHGIPTARYVRASDKLAAEAALEDFPAPLVIKADGLAAGKGVIICATRGEALAALDTMFDGSFGAAGRAIVIEEFLEGEEASFFALTDGATILPFGSAQDHKRAGDGDTGPNTGGMGAYSPAAILTPELEARTMDEIVRPTVEALAAQGAPYSGILYAGLMLTAEGPKLIEYNARFGDPECQVLMMRLESDLLELIYAVARGRLAEAQPPRFADGAALAVVMAANGYPGTPETGGSIEGLDGLTTRDVRIFHAGTAIEEGRLVARGGRVLNVAAAGGSVGEARARAYAAVGRIRFPSGFCRSDIGWREIARSGGAG
ncbi:MAG TPA: phosphoribosylamine--glycine ligase [Allosphingosinicella sp.]|jgi:phosphoribosylamine--glycine ligase|nr:phosphoribosylamine--glycine ligase [Allosphingosinicella sp.]